MLTQHSPNTLQSSLKSLIACIVSQSTCSCFRETIGRRLPSCRSLVTLMRLLLAHISFPASVLTIPQMQSLHLDPALIIPSIHPILTTSFKPSIAASVAQWPKTTKVQTEMVSPDNLWVNKESIKGNKVTYIIQYLRTTVPKHSSDFFAMSIHFAEVVLKPKLLLIVEALRLNMCLLSFLHLSPPPERTFAKIFLYTVSKVFAVSLPNK